MFVLKTRYLIYVLLFFCCDTKDGNFLVIVAWLPARELQEDLLKWQRRTLTTSSRLPLWWFLLLQLRQTSNTSYTIQAMFSGRSFFLLTILVLAGTSTANTVMPLLLQQFLLCSLFTWTVTLWLVCKRKEKKKKTFNFLLLKYIKTEIHFSRKPKMQT